jgi:photosystem II stability/assembly factor-like uncharacterized protein
MLKHYISFFLLLFSSSFISAQQISIINNQHPGSLRGLSAVNDQIIWVSGSSGCVGRSTDGGKDWKWLKVPRYENTDFRDIEAFSDQEAIIMGITQPAVILRTVNGGLTWATVFEDSAKSVFLDAMDFSGDTGVVVGDPDSGRIFFARTRDRGNKWERIDPAGFESIVNGEAFFASSGSNLSLVSNMNPAVSFYYTLVSGGSKSSLFHGGNHFPLALMQGRESTGANSIAINPYDHNRAFIVGGDFKNDTVRTGNSLQIQFNPFLQIVPVTPPHGYRSCVEYIDSNSMICSGTSGVDISIDGGKNWRLISNLPFHVCRRSKQGHSVFLAGANGIIAKLTL